MKTLSIASRDILQIDAAVETESISSAIREIVRAQFKRKGAVIAVSGGIDSSVVAALCVHALGPECVIALSLPEAESSPDSLRLGKLVADSLGIRLIEEDITPILRAAGCYERRDAAIRKVFPEFEPGYKAKITLPDMVETDRYAIFSLVVQTPSGELKKVRLPLDSYLGIVAATNFKQRTRAMLEYYFADRYHYAVAGTPNRLEYDQGFFVKNGDGASDFKPIAHLYKSQVYQLAAYLHIPEEVQERIPTTDTYSLEQNQEEFYFSVPLKTMDLCLHGRDHGVSPTDLSELVGLNPQQVRRMYEIIDSKRRAARYLHQAPVLVKPLS